jgi:phosphoribosyl 1,2-cyclic phosphodiesterase
LQLLTAKRIVLTHMSEKAMACREEMEALGLTLAKDGLAFDL